jgi:hypothetical protein
MPRYTFITDDGEQVEHICSCKDLTDTITLEDGRTAKRDFAADVLSIARPSPTSWPMKPCVSTGVNVAQAQELRDFYKKHGESIEVSSSGDPIYTSQRQMNRDLKLRGFVDLN